MKIRYRIITALLAVLCILPFTSCKKQDNTKTEEIKRAEFTNQSKMLSSDGLSIIMDNEFEKQYSDDCALSCVNGDLTFEGFFFEKYYFTEKDKSVDSPKKALEFVYKDKEVKINSLDMPYTEYTEVKDGVSYTFYYVCIEDSERYWFCTFFSPTDIFDSYREKITEYLGTITAVYLEE